MIRWTGRHLGLRAATVARGTPATAAAGAERPITALMAGDDYSLMGGSRARLVLGEAGEDPGDGKKTARVWQLSPPESGPCCLSDQRKKKGQSGQPAMGWHRTVSPPGNVSYL